MTRRASIYKPKEEKSRYSSQYALTGKVICEECLAPYRRITWSRNGKKKIIWRCITRLDSGIRFCKHSPTISEDELIKHVLEEIKAKMNGINIEVKVKRCFKQLDIEIPHELSNLAASQDARWKDCFDQFVRQTIQKIIISKTNICIFFIDTD